MRPQLSPDPRAVAIALFIVVVALVAVVAYLMRLNAQLDRRAAQADTYEAEAEAWKANYYTCAAERDHARRRNSALTGQLNTLVDLFSADVQALPTSPDQEL